MSADEGQEELEEVSAELKKREENVGRFNANINILIFNKLSYCRHLYNTIITICKNTCYKLFILTNKFWLLCF